MDQMQLSDSDFEVVSPVSNQSITQVSRNVHQNPLFARYQLKAAPISIKCERKYVNPHVNKFKVPQIQALVFDDIPSGYIQKNVVLAEEMLEVLLFESKAKAVEVLMAKTTIRNKMTDDYQFACCFNDLHNMDSKPKEKPKDTGELNELISIFEAEQNESSFQNDQDQFVTRKIKSFKNECKRSASVIQIKGSTINKSKFRYCKKFEHVITQSGEIQTFNQIENQISYFQVVFQKGQHHTGINPCYFRRTPTRCKFTEKQTKLLLTFQSGYSYDQFDAFWTFNKQNFTQSKQQVQTKLHQMYEDNVEQAEQLYQFALKHNLNYEHFCNQATSFQHHFAFCNENAKQFFNNEALQAQIDWTFFKINQRQMVCVQLLSSSSFSKLGVVVAYYIVVKNQKATQGECDQNTELSISYFASQLEFNHIQTFLSDSGVVYVNNKLKDCLNLNLRKLNKKEFEGRAGRCGYHSWTNLKPGIIPLKYRDDNRDIKFEMQIAYFDWLSAAFEVEKEHYFKVLENLFAQAGLANKQPYSAKLDALKKDEQHYCILYRPMKFQGPLIQTTQIGESLNYSRLKKLLNSRSGLFDMVVALSCTDSSFQDTIQNHFQKNSYHSNSDVLFGCVLKANELVEITIKTAPKRYNIKIIQQKEQQKLQISLKANKKLIIPHLYDLQQWQEIVNLASQFISNSNLFHDQEFMTQYNERLDQIRCPCAYRVQCGLSCCHEMIILSHLDALKNKYLITSLIRVEYSQQYLNEKLQLYFQAREFYTLHSYGSQNHNSQLMMPIRPKTFQGKNRLEMITYIKTELNPNDYDDEELTKFCETINIINRKYLFKITTPSRIIRGSRKRNKGKQ
ncbi:Conserved_hypothetical protein [Hexamita inflata]|uniref:SWIM-type domain-containing protein n=1 Tax=Hexamita inflata TaxID=28002 RepID=A0AA86QK76_9EUKA|nr:Conserved hypothetical protein [Hexamita inflata]